MHPLNVQVHLFLIDLYDKKREKDELEETVSGLLYLKGDTNLEEFVRRSAGNRFTSVHTFDDDMMLSIIKQTLISQAEEIKAKGTISNRQ